MHAGKVICNLAVAKPVGVKRASALRRAFASGKSGSMARPRLICLLLALLTLLLYLPVRQHGFIVYDDELYVTENRMVQRGLTWDGVKWAFTTLHASNWHPLTWLSHMLDWELFGANPGAYHLVNVLFHAANTVLLFLLLSRLTAALWPAAMVAALFAWHPLHVESVAWISERKDVLCAFFSLLALHAYVRYARDKSRRAFMGSLLLFAIGLMAKPMLVTLPFVFLLLDYWPLKRSLKFSPLIFEKLPFFLLTAVSCLITVIAQSEKAMVDLERQPLSARMANAVVAYATYLVDTVWPSKLAIVYPLDAQLPVVRVVTSAALLGVLSFIAWRWRSNRPWLMAGWLWYVGMLVPVIGLVQVGLQARADRYTYLPLIGIFIAVVFAAREVISRLRLNPKVAVALAALCLLGFAAATLRQLSCWRNSETLFAHALAVTKENVVAHLNLGIALEEAGKKEEALAHYREALRIQPQSAQGHNNIANVLAALGKTEEALQHYQQSLRFSTKAPLAHLNLGLTLVGLGRFEEALQHYSEAARLSPDDPRPRYFMGKVHLKQKQSPQALADFRDALRVAPDDVRTLAWTARVLAADMDPNLRDGRQAMALAERANQLTGGSEPFVLDTLAMAYAEAGQFTEAARVLEQAIRLTADLGANGNESETQEKLPLYQSEMQERLRLYQSSQPYREDWSSVPSGR
jgi:protein O-mannosyl-transferase